MKFNNLNSISVASYNDAGISLDFGAIKGALLIKTAEAESRIMIYYKLLAPFPMHKSKLEGYMHTIKRPIYHLLGSELATRCD